MPPKRPIPGSAVSESVTPPFGRAFIALLFVGLGGAVMLRANGSPRPVTWLAPLLQVPACVMWGRAAFGQHRAIASGLDRGLFAVVGVLGAILSLRAGRVEFLLLGPAFFLAGWASLGWLSRVLARIERDAGDARRVLGHVLPGWALLMIAAAIVLALPISTRSGVPDYRHNFWSHVLSSAVTAVSAGCLSGQTIYSLGEDFSRVGQAVVFGVTVLSGLAWLSVGTSLAQPLVGRALPIATVLKTAAAVLLAGAALLFPVWSSTDAPTADVRAGWSVVHASSALFNAGWTLKASGLAAELRNPLAFASVTMLAVLGSLGLPVVAALLRPLPGAGGDAGATGATRGGAWAIWETGVFGAVLAAVALILFMCETPRFLPAHLTPTRPVEFGGALPSLHDQMSHGERWSFCVFAAATRSAGLQSFTVSQGGISWPGYATIMAASQLGGSIGGLGSGFRLTVFSLAAMFWLTPAMAARDGATRRRVLARFALIPFASLGLTALAILALRMCCDGTLYEIAFDAAAAANNVGLSTGLTTHLPWAGRLLLICFMILGRLLPIWLWAWALSPWPMLEARGAAR